MMNTPANAAAPAAKRGRGRPKGSKNKPKPTAVVKYVANMANPPPPPAYVEPGAVGADVRACCTLGSGLVVPPRGSAIIDCGYDVEVSAGFELQVRPRSGLAASDCVTVLNSPGTIDPSYRGPLKVILINHSDDPFKVEHGDRIAQLVVAPVVRAQHVIVDALSPSDRGSNGLGSTGRA